MTQHWTKAELITLYHNLMSLQHLLDATANENLQRQYGIAIKTVRTSIRQAERQLGPQWRGNGTTAVLAIR